MSRTIVVVIGDNWAEFSGWQTRELYTRLFRRPPVFNTRTKRWVTTPDKVAELIAAAEHEGWTVTVHRGAQSDESSTVLDSSTGHRRGQSEPEEARLW